MDIKEKIKELKRKYGEFVVDIDGELISIKVPVSFYEEMLVASASPNEEEATKKAVEYFIREMPKHVAKQFNIPVEDAKILVMNYLTEFIESFTEALGKKKQ